MRKKKIFYKLILAVYVLAQFQFLTLLNIPTITIPGTNIHLNPHKLSFLNPGTLDSAGLSSASATLSNSRLSFFGNLNAALNSGATVITLETTAATYGDINTNNLFPGDLVGIGTNGLLPVASISSSTVFTLRNPLTANQLITANVYATQSGTLLLDFYTSAAVPAGGSIRVEIPAPTANGNDGAPDTGATIGANGFDLNGIVSGNITCPPGFTQGTVTAGTGGAPHMVSCNTAATIPAGAHFGVTIGNGARGLVNPAPIHTSHTQGNADIYTIAAYTRDSSNGAGNNIESIEVKTAPIEGVMVTATVDETLSFQIAGVDAAASTYCGAAHTDGITTTATAVPWGIINSAYTVDKNNAVQQLTVSTNAPTGYNVYAEENDQMGKDGAACTGAAPSAEPYTFTGGGICIRDYNKGAASSTTSTDWTTAPGSDYGFGYSLQNQAGTDARFTWGSAGQFLAKHFADQENGQSKYAANADIMSGNGPRSGSSVYVCYRIHVPAAQPAGYYFNNLKYTAVAKF